MRILITVSISIMLLGMTGCSGILFFPQEEQVLTPDQLDIEYEDIFLESSDNVTVHGWWLKATEPVLGTIYFLHGNAENISTHIRNIYWLPRRGYQVFLIDYRGFGLSTGTPTLPGALEDIRTGFQFVVDRNAGHGKPIYLLGQSLGASMALYFAATDPAAKQQLNAVISDAAFSRYSDIARYAAGRSWLTWVIQYPVSWSMIRGYDPIDYVAEISPVRLLLIHSRDDQIIPFINSQQLREAASPPKTFYETRGPHTATFRSEQNREYLLNYMARTASDPSLR